MDELDNRYEPAPAIPTLWLVPSPGCAAARLPDTASI
jgi:hypothetical protein